MGLGGRYARAPGAVGRKLLPGVPGREQTVGRGDRRGRLLRDCAQRSLGAEKHVAGRHQKEGESSGAWPYSDDFYLDLDLEEGWVSRRPRWHMLRRKRTSSNFAFPEGAILTGWMPSSPVVESKKRKKVWCGWTPLSVASSATWKVSFRVLLGPSVTGSGRFEREILSPSYSFPNE